MFCCTLPYVYSSIAIIFSRKRELVGLLNLSSWCLVMVKRLFLAVPWGCLRFVIVVFPDHTHYFPFKGLYYRYLQNMVKLLSTYPEVYNYFKRDTMLSEGVIYIWPGYRQTFS